MAGSRNWTSWYSTDRYTHETESEARVSTLSAKGCDGNTGEKGPYWFGQVGLEKWKRNPQHGSKANGMEMERGDRLAPLVCQGKIRIGEPESQKTFGNHSTGEPRSSSACSKCLVILCQKKKDANIAKEPLDTQLFSTLPSQSL